MKCLVTGGNGFIGSHLTSTLVEMGADVSIIVKPQTKTPETINKSAKIHFINIIDDLPNYIFEDIDVVFHTVALANTPACIKDPNLCFRTNVNGSLNVLEACRYNKVKRVVVSSSNAVLGHTNPYKASMMAVEELCKVYSELYGLSVVGLRYSNVYGKNQSEKWDSPTVFAAFRKQKREKGYITILGDGEQTRCYTHVSDIVRANILAAKSDYCGVMDICTGVMTSLNKVAEYFQCPVQYLPARGGDAKHITQGSGHAKAMLDFTTKIPLEEGIKEML